MSGRGTEGRRKKESRWRVDGEDSEDGVLEEEAVKMNKEGEQFMCDCCVIFKFIIQN